jgi:hypothetical protein
MAERFKTFTPATGWQLKEAKTTSVGAGDAGKIVALDSAGKLDPSLLPSIDADVSTLPSSENLTAGNLVNVWNDAGTMKVRKADATTSAKRSDGYVLANVTSPANALIYHDGLISGLTGLTLGARYYLSTTPGGVVVEASTGVASGNLVQYIGIARSTTEIVYEPDTIPSVIA